MSIKLTYRLINTKKPNKIFFKTEDWIRKYPYIMKSHSLKVDDPKEISTDFLLFLKSNDLLLNIGTPNPPQSIKPIKTKPIPVEIIERFPADDEQPEDVTTMKMADLRDTAKNKGLDIKGVKKKSEIIKLLLDNGNK